MARTATSTRPRRKERKNITSGVAHVAATFNNTVITITDAQGNAIAWSSAGSQGFKGSRKSTPYAAQVAAEDAGKKAREHGMDTDPAQRLPAAQAPARIRRSPRKREEACRSRSVVDGPWPKPRSERLEP